MAEPSRTIPLDHLSNFIMPNSLSVSRRGELLSSRNILQETRSGTLRHPRWVGYDRGYGDLSPVSLPFRMGFQARLEQFSLESDRALSSDAQDWAKFQYEAGLAHRRDQDVYCCPIHPKEAIKVYCRAGNLRGLTGA